jgi:hypothetical protein
MVFQNSPLATYSKLSPNNGGVRNHEIDTITIHCCAGPITIENLGNMFSLSKTAASSNYGIDGEGKIGVFVPEWCRSWCSSNRDNDDRAVTIEVANTDFAEPYAVTDAAYQALIALCVDICKRQGIKALKWSTNKTERVNHLNGCNMTVHRDYANKSCPGTFLYEHMGDIAARVNCKLMTDAYDEGIKPVNGCTVSLPLLKKGIEGESVRALQILLNGRLDTRLVKDGDFGPATDKAVRRFQEENGLAADGIVGAKTWTKLL